jgi:hypothetical protein
VRLQQGVGTLGKYFCNLKSYGENVPKQHYPIDFDIVKLVFPVR